MNASIRDVKAAVTVPQFLESIGVHVLPAGKEQKFQALCHADKHPSGTIYDDGRSWHCFPCNKGGDVLDLAELKYPGTPAEVLKILADRFSVTGDAGVITHFRSVSALPPARPAKTSKSSKSDDLGPVVARYTIPRELMGGKLIEQTRHDRKDFRWWTNGKMGLERLKPSTFPLYLSWDIKPGNVVIVEGPKAALAARRMGLNAVSCYGVANMPTLETLAFLKGRDVTLWPDNDEKGREFMRGLAALLKGLAA